MRPRGRVVRMRVPDAPNSLTLLSLALLLCFSSEARADYLSTADRLQVHLDPIWSADRGAYDPGPGATTTQVNGALLLVHSVAALHGHDGPARNDQRARLIARFLTGPRVWTDRPCRARSRRSAARLARGTGLPEPAPGVRGRGRRRAGERLPRA